MRLARISVVNTHRNAIEEEPSVYLPRAVGRVHQVARDKPDLILLPETFANNARQPTRRAALASAQDLDGPITDAFGALARRYKAYIAFGLLRRQGARVFNSLVMLNRRGKPAWIYDKVTPMTVEITRYGIHPGGKPAPFDCDFGRVGGAICFDLNFSELAEIYWRQDVELVLFSSAFPGGRLLDHWPVRYGFAVAQSTWYDRNRILDCTGAMVAQTSDLLPTMTACLNLNRRVVHMDFNLAKLDRMRDKYHGDVLVEDLRPEATCVITSLKPGLEVADLIREFKVETLPHYFARARRTRAAYGGLCAG
jgi:predicted amidohydrolase